MYRIFVPLALPDISPHPLSPARTKRKIRSPRSYCLDSLISVLWVVRSLGGLEAQHVHNFCLHPPLEKNTALIRVSKINIPDMIFRAPPLLWTSCLGDIKYSLRFLLFDHLQFHWGYRRIRSSIPRLGNLSFSRHKGLDPQVCEKNLKLSPRLLKKRSEDELGSLARMCS